MNNSLPIISVNACGSCTACCVLLDVKSIEKPANTPCSHLCAEGCGIYASRPKECRDYSCYWLESRTNALEMRPDQLGVIIEINETNLGKAVVVREFTTEIENNKNAQRFAYNIAEQHTAFIYVIGRNGENKVILPEWASHLERKLRELADAKEREVEGSETKQEPQIEPQAEVPEMPVSTYSDYDRDYRSRRRTSDYYEPPDIFDDDL
jgi:hypothetical protein